MVKNFVPNIESVLCKVSDILESALESASEFTDEKRTKLNFLIRQLQLLASKQYNTADFCFAVEHFPRCTYEHLREYLVLPSKRKLQSIISSTNISKVLDKTFSKIKCEEQKQCLLIVDEVKIRPTVAYSGGVLSGMAANDPEVKATAMLGILLKCLHGGPSLMISVTPVHGSTGQFQYQSVIQNATAVEKAGGIVIGSITDNHKVNQNYCRLFTRNDKKAPHKAVHPLDKNRTWFLLFDTVHLLKCIRNNWISEKTQTLTLDGQKVGVFEDVRQLYLSEKDSILKTSPLTYASVFPSKLQLQNVQHVLKVFNEKVVAALRLMKKDGTADFIQQILTWWNIVNVSSKGQDQRMRDPNRAVQDAQSTNLQSYLTLFSGAKSGK